MASASKFITWSIRSVVIVRVLCINSCVERAKLLAAMSGNKIYNVYFIIVFQWPRHRSALLSFFYESFRAISSDEFSVSLAFTLTGVDHIMFKVEIMSNEDREWHESFSLVLGPDDPVEAVLGDTSTATVTILDQEAAGSLILPAQPVVSCPLQWMRFSTLQDSELLYSFWKKHKELQWCSRLTVSGKDSLSCSSHQTQVNASILYLYRSSPWLIMTVWKKRPSTVLRNPLLQAILSSVSLPVILTSPSSWSWRSAAARPGSTSLPYSSAGK